MVATAAAPYSSSTGWSEPVDYVMIVSSVLIAVFGTASNILSLSFFIKMIRSNFVARNSDASTTKLFAALNISDLLVSVSSAFEFMLFQFFVVVKVFQTFSMISVLMTGFLTCLLAVVRLIHLSFPLYIINCVSVNLSIVVYSLVVVGLRVFRLQQTLDDTSSEVFWIALSKKVEFSIMACMFLTVVLSNLIILMKLCFSPSSQRESWKRRAIITVAIISVIYCVCNIGIVVIFGAYAWGYNHLIPIKLLDISYYILLPLNSACNPVVYFIRRKDMKSYIKTLCGRYAGCLCKKEIEENARTELQTGIITAV